MLTTLLKTQRSETLSRRNTARVPLRAARDIEAREETAASDAAVAARAATKSSNRIPLIASARCQPRVEMQINATTYVCTFDIGVLATLNC